MSSIALSFNNVDLTPIDNGDGQLWVTSKQLAEALGYKSADSITKLYNRNKHEFSKSMTQVIENTRTVNMTASGITKMAAFATRIFSMRGAHLVAMFARTKKAAEFRVWALDVIDEHIENNKIPLSIQQSLNAVHAIRAIEFDKASGYGFGLNKWKGDKKVLDEAEAVILEHLQPELPNIDNKGGEL